MGDQNLGEARDLEVGLAKGGSDIGKITGDGVFHHPAIGPRDHYRQGKDAAGATVTDKE
jgi:hypothetical protein